MFKETVNWEQELPSILDRLENGDSLQDIGNSYSVSKQRVYQVLRKFKVDLKGIKQGYRARRDTAKEEAYNLKWGNKERSDYDILRAKFRAKKANAIRLGIDFDIEFGELTFPEYCPILDMKLNYRSSLWEDNAASFDRIDPKKGYISGNVQVISMRANRIKNDSTLEELRKLVNFLERQKT